MDVREQIDAVRTLLLKNKRPSYQTTNKKEVRVRCPYCGDSRKDKNHAHMYVEMSPPFKFYCQRCNTAGALNSQTLRDMNVFNNDISISIIEANKSIRHKQTAKLSFTTFKTKLNSVESEHSQACENYVSARLGKTISNETLVKKYKAVTNAQQFFIDNNIPTPMDYRNRVMYDFDHSVGFLSSDGSHVIYRDMTGEQRRKYFNHNLQPHNFSPSGKIYNIRSEIDVMTEKLNLIITEGIFDIIGVYEHFYKDKLVDNDKNHVFAASCGKGFMAVISHYLTLGFLDLDITIYSDSDVNIGFYKNLKESSPYLKNTPITIFYNTIEKDYGIPKENIKLRRAII